MNLELKQFTEEDIPEIVSWIPNKEFLLQWAGPSYTMEFLETQLREDLNKNLEENSKGMLFSAKNSVTSETVGHIQLLGIDKANMSARICRVIVNNSFRNNGIGLKMINEVLKIAFDELKLHRVDLGVFSFNKSAIACYEKAGFVVEGTFRDCRKINNEYWSIVNMSILDQEYRQLL